MRILGRCPECSAQDSIVTQDNALPQKLSEASCEQCHAVWENCFNLVDREGQDGNKLIPVEIEVNRRRAWLEWPKARHIPDVRVIKTVFNVALMVRFKMGVCLATEGGVEGIIGQEPIELRNLEDEIGLFDGHGFDPNPKCQQALSWYASALRVLFEEELVVGGKNFGRGVILKLSDEKEGHKENVVILLWIALWKKTGSKRFATQVFKRLKTELGRVTGDYIAGLTLEQIVERFIPSPLWRE